MIIEPENYIDMVHQITDNDPPSDPKDLDVLWQDFDKDSLDEELADLWRWGIIEVSMRNGEQYIQMSAFGEELHQLGVHDEYVSAMLGNPIKFDGFESDHAAVRSLNQFK
jgi:hypothetical protein